MGRTGMRSIAGTIVCIYLFIYFGWMIVHGFMVHLKHFCAHTHTQAQAHTYTHTHTHTSTSTHIPLTNTIPLEPKNLAPAQCPCAGRAKSNITPLHNISMPFLHTHTHTHTH